jgi:hypothetical protein
MTVSSITSASTPTYTTSGTPPAATPTPTTSVTMSTLVQQAGIVATLGGAPSGFQTYDATGLLNQVAAAGNAAAAAAVQPPGAAGTSTSQDASTTTSPASATSVAAAAAGDWGSILKANPALTSVAVADAVAQGIVNTINVYA